MSDVEEDEEVDPNVSMPTVCMHQPCRCHVEFYIKHQPEKEEEKKKNRYKKVKLARRTTPSSVPMVVNGNATMHIISVHFPHAWLSLTSCTRRAREKPPYINHSPLANINTRSVLFQGILLHMQPELSVHILECSILYTATVWIVLGSTLVC